MSERLFGFRARTQLRNDRGALPTWSQLTEERWKSENYAAFPEGTLLQKGVRDRAAQLRRRQQRREDQKIWKRENFQSFSKSRCRTVVIVVFMDMVTFKKNVFIGGVILHHRTHGDTHPNQLHLTSQHTP